MQTLIKLGKWLLPLGAAAVVLLALGVIGRAIYHTVETRTVARSEVACKVARQKKDWVALEAHARTWLDWERDSGLAWLYLGEAAQRQEKWELTAECLAAVPEDDPRCVPSLLELLELQLGRFEDPVAATATAEKILRLNPRESTARQRLIYIFSMTLQRQRLAEQIRLGMQHGGLTSEMVVYRISLGSLRFSNGVTVNHRWLRAVPDSEIVQVAQAVQLAAMTQGTASTTLAENELHPGDQSLVDACRQKFPRNIEVVAFYLDKGIEKGDFDEVARLLDAAPVEAEVDSRFWRAKGWLHQGRGELAESAEAFEQALKVDPYDWRARHQFAGVLRRQNRPALEIDRQASLVLEGKLLERQMLELPTASEIPPQLGVSLIKYCEGIGDTELVRAMRATFHWENFLRGGVSP